MQGKKIDQILSPLPIDHSFLPSARRIRDYRCGGSFALVLDGKSNAPHWSPYQLGAARARHDETRRGHRTQPFATRPRTGGSPPQGGGLTA